MSMGNLSESARRKETWANIDEYTNKVRQEMTAKYMVEFK
jgi:hypothetical protein